MNTSKPSQKQSKSLIRNLFTMKNQQLKRVIAVVTLMFSVTQTFAQDEIGTKIGEWTETLKTSLNAGVAGFAIVGGFIIFIQYMQGNDSAQKNFIKFVIGLAIFGLVGLIANVFLPAAP